MSSWFSWLRSTKFDELRARPTTEQIRAFREPERGATARRGAPRRASISYSPVMGTKVLSLPIVVQASHLPQLTETPGRYITVHSANSDWGGEKVLLSTCIATGDRPTWGESCDVDKRKLVSFTAWHIASEGGEDTVIGTSDTYTGAKWLEISLGNSIAIPLDVIGKGKHKTTSLFIIVEELGSKARASNSLMANTEPSSGAGRRGSV
ncbi:hypothetical protein HDZ31DRAFT_33679 [Schizophyllum fasciatum]